MSRHWALSGPVCREAPAGSQGVLFQQADQGATTPWSCTAALHIESRTHSSCTTTAAPLLLCHGVRHATPPHLLIWPTET